MWCFLFISLCRPSRMMQVSGYGSSSSFLCVHFHFSSWIGIITDINNLWNQEVGRRSSVLLYDLSWIRHHQPFPVATVSRLLLFCMYMHWTLCTQLGVSQSVTCNSSVIRERSYLSSNALSHHLVGTLISQTASIMTDHSNSLDTACFVEKDSGTSIAWI